MTPIWRHWPFCIVFQSRHAHFRYVTDHVISSAHVVTGSCVNSPGGLRACACAWVAGWLSSGMLWMAVWSTPFVSPSQFYISRCDNLKTTQWSGWGERERRGGGGQSDGWLFMKWCLVSPSPSVYSCSSLWCIHVCLCISMLCENDSQCKSMLL